ncbi:hypothetical protein niasHT_000930 [Heterodera trifolii]|uniref:Uncharacterized protein n=1 Tax=Heterodera trifolii TaxID=157864 RepID=A0ABD2M0L5_9BILA
MPPITSLNINGIEETGDGLDTQIACFFSSISMVQQTNIPLEPQKLSFVLLFLVVAALSNWAALSYVHDFIGRTPLPDIVFTFIDEQPWAHPVGDFMVGKSN